MNDPSESKAQVAGPADGWLMLITEVPSKPDYLRVKLRRRIQRIGAIGLKGAVYLLPRSPDSLEDFQWLRQETIADGGDATVCSAQMMDGMSDSDLIARFNRERDYEYLEFSARCDELAGKWAGAAAGGDDGEHAGFLAERARWITRLEEILDRDFFMAPQRETAMQAIERLAVMDIMPPTAPAAIAAAGKYTGRTWATRAGVKVDRIASAWLIRRKIDPGAVFLFVPEGTRVLDGSVQFDMFDGEFTHDGRRCTFEVLLDRFSINDASLRAIGQMVHDIDLHDDAFGRPETAGLAAMIDGIVKALPDDDDRLREGARVLELLAAATGLV